MKTKLWLVGLCWAWASVAGAQTCLFPWTDTHDRQAAWQTGFYRHPYPAVVEVVAVVGGWVYARNVEGWACQAQAGVPAKSQVVVVDRGRFRLADCRWPVTESVGVWGRLPAGCYPASTVVWLDAGAVGVRVGTP